MFTLLYLTFRVPHVGKVSIHGLKDLSYIDKTLDGAPTLKEDREAVTLSSWTDRVYLSAPNNLSIQGAGSSGGKLSLSKTNLADCVVWNPWAEKAAGMGDLGAENWEGFVCVEAGQCVTPTTLAPGQQWTATHRLQYSP